MMNAKSLKVRFTEIPFSTYKAMKVLFSRRYRALKARHIGEPWYKARERTAVSANLPAAERTPPSDERETGPGKLSSSDKPFLSAMEILRQPAGSPARDLYFVNAKHSELS